MTTLEVDKCVICYDGYTEEDVQTITFGCSHKFHSMCIIGWIDTIGRNDNTSRCPQCRQTVIKWPERIRYVQAIAQRRENRYWSSYIVTHCLLMAIFWLLYTSAALLTMQIGPTIMSYDNTSQCASSSPLILDSSLLTFIHNNCRERSFHSSHFFHPSFIIVTDIFYVSLYVIHLADTILSGIPEFVVLFIRLLRRDADMLVRRFDVIYNLIESEVLFLERVLNSTIERQSLLWDHTNRPNAIIRHTIENVATFLLYMSHTITIFFVFTLMQGQRVLHVFTMGDVMYPPEQILGLMGSSTFTFLNEFYKSGGILSLRFFDCSPDIIIRFTPFELFIFVIPLLYQRLPSLLS